MTRNRARMPQDGLPAPSTRIPACNRRGEADGACLTNRDGIATRGENKILSGSLETPFSRV